MKEYYEQVNVPKAPEEPDERIDKMTGMPYDVQAGEAFIDEEDRFGFAAGGLIAIIKRLSRGVDDIVEDTRPTTRFNADDGTRETLRDFRYRETENFVDPNSPDYSVTRVTKDNADNNIEYQQPDNRYFEARKSTEDRLAKELDDEFNVIPEDDMDLVQRYVDDIPKVSDRPPVPSNVSKEEFIKGSVEQKPQYNGRFFSETRYDNPLSARIPRELGMHIGTKGQSETILMRGTHPTAENMIERVAIAKYMDDGMTQSQAKVAVVEEGIPDEVMDFIVKELNESVPIGVEPSLQQGFINVKNPLVLDTDMINWNPAKFLGGSDPSGNLKLAEQAQTFVDALNKQVELPDAQFTQIVDDASAQIDSIIRKKDMNSGKLLNAAYDHNINIVTRNMLEDLGFDSIQYRNLGELTRVSERQAGGNSYILFKEDQFATDFKDLPPVKPFDSIPKPATYDEMFDALDVKKKDKINVDIPEGESVGIRLDIPAYRDHNTWIPTIHAKGRTSHRATVYIEDVNLTPTKGNEETAYKIGQAKYFKNEIDRLASEGKLRTGFRSGDYNKGELIDSSTKEGKDAIKKIKTGYDKTNFSRIEGSLVNKTDEENFKIAQEALNSEEWTQVGYNPERHSYYFDRATGEPILSGDTAVQVGPLVLVKNAKFGNRSDFKYATGGRVLRSLGRTRRAEGGFMGKINKALAKLVGRGPKKQMDTFIEAVNLNNQFVDLGILKPNQRIKYAEWEMTKDKEGKPVPVKDERGYKVPSRFLTEQEVRNFNRDNVAMGISGNEESFNAIQHALLGYDNAYLTSPFVQGRELLSAQKQIDLGNDPRTEHGDRWNNSFGIDAKRRGVSREDFKYTNIANSIGYEDNKGTKYKMQNNIPLERGSDLITNMADVPPDFISKTMDRFARAEQEAEERNYQ